ncbi:hypothetical protein [Sulfurisphaera ohwakuensis]|uniref:hypothetical protein n=1 Tax=Sulfurisphaera ohwakuensis TaxID=69656 RepID=UPI0036F1E3DD
MKFDLDRIKRNLENVIEDPTTRRDFKELAQEILSILQEGNAELVYFVLGIDNKEDK